MRQTMKMRFRRMRGFSLIELLIAIIILGVLAAILIPIVSNRTKQARLVSAQTDMEHIGEAEARVAIDTGYYVRLWMLNDNIGGDNSPFVRGGPLQDDVQSITGGGYFTITSVFIEPSTGELVDSTVSTQQLARLQANETAFNWNGPYMNWHRDSNLYAGDTGGPLPDGIPDDPWGNNYLLFTSEGLVLEPDGQIVTTAALPVDTPGSVSTSGLDFFADRLTIVSLGPDGLPGNGGTAIGEGDDIVRLAGK